METTSHLLLVEAKDERNPTGVGGVGGAVVAVIRYPLNSLSPESVTGESKKTHRLFDMNKLTLCFFFKTILNVFLHNRGFVFLRSIAL